MVCSLPAMALRVHTVRLAPFSACIPYNRNSCSHARGLIAVDMERTCGDATVLAGQLGPENLSPHPVWGAGDAGARSAARRAWLVSGGRSHGRGRGELARRV